MHIIESEWGLGLRSQSEPPEDISGFSRRQIENWLSELPRANIGQTAKQIYTRLCEANLLVLPVATRLAFLKALQPEIETLQKSLEKYFVTAGISLKTKPKKVAELSRAILNEQALAYKAVVHQILSSSHQHKKKHELAQALGFALYFIARLIGHCYQLYMTPPAQLWKEIHILFQLSEKQGLDKESMALPHPQVKTSLRTVYKATLLLALAHPNELRSGDFYSLQFDALEFARKIRLTRDITDDIEYVVNINSKAAPFHRSLMTTQIDKQHLGINVQPLLFDLQILISSKKMGQTQLKPALIRHLVRAIGNLATRSFSRTPCNDSIQVAIGLASTHALIEQGEQDPSMQNQSFPLNGEDALTALEGSLKNVKILNEEDTLQTHFLAGRNSASNAEENKWLRMYRPRVSVNDSSELQESYHLMAASPSEKPLPKDYRLLAAAILNISPGGYCLKLDGELPRQTQTDEIIGLMEIDNKGGCRWNIGTIRWLQRLANQQLSAGVQLISPNAKSVNTTLKVHSNQNYATHRSLLLPSLAHIGQPASIITPTLPYEVGSVVRIKLDGETSDIKLEELIETGRSYLRFTFVELNPRKKQPRKQDRFHLDDNDFSTIWEIL